MILRLPVGIFSDSIRNRRWFIGAGLLFACISSIGLGLSSTPGQLLLFRSIAGIAAAMFVVFPGYITEMAGDNDNHKVMGVLSAVNKTGRMAAIFLGGLAVQFLGGKWAFLFGGIVAGFAILIWFALPSDKYHEDHQNHSIKELVGIIKDRDLYISAGLTALFQFAVFATTYTFTPVIAKSIGMSDISIGFLTALFTLTGIVSALISGTILKRLLGPKKTVALSFGMSGIAFAIMPFVNSPGILYLLQVVAGLAMGMILPLLMGQCLKNIPKEKKGTAMGFYQATYGIGMVLGPYIVGLIIRYGNIKTGYITVLAICMTAAILTYLYGREDRKNGLAKY
jgi:MFS family permease